MLTIRRRVPGGRCRAQRLNVEQGEEANVVASKLSFPHPTPTPINPPHIQITMDFLKKAAESALESGTHKETTQSNNSDNSNVTGNAVADGLLGKLNSTLGSKAEEKEGAFRYPADIRTCDAHCSVVLPDVFDKGQFSQRF